MKNNRKARVFIVILVVFVIFFIFVIVVRNIENSFQATYTPESSHVGQGNAYLEKAMYDNAISEFNEAIKENQPLCRAYYNRGRAYNAKGSVDQAIEDYTKAIGLCQSSTTDSMDFLPASYNNRGLAYSEKGEYAKELEDYTKGIAAMISNPWSNSLRQTKSQLYANRAKAYFRKGDYKSAAEDLENIKKLGFEPDPQFADLVKQKLH